LRFIHAADIHLDSPIRGLGAYEGAPVEAIRGAPRRALVNMVELALSEGVDFVLVAGDLFDGDWKDYNTGLFLSAQMSRLREADIPVFIVSGNHDAASRITKYLRMPDNVRILSSKAPETILMDDLGVAIHGQGYASRAVSEDISAAYPQALPGYFNIGLLHTCLDGRPGHESYAPTSAPALVSKGYDYWALGHVHAHEVVKEAPWIVFPGNIQGRNIRETGQKGCVLVSVQEDGAVSLEHRGLDVMRWVLLRPNVSRADDFEDLCMIVSGMLSEALRENDMLPLAVRLELEGADVKDMPEDPEQLRSELRSVALQAGDGRIWLEKIRFFSRQPPSIPSSAGDAISVLLDTLEGLKEEGELMTEAIEALRPLNERLPFELKSGEEALRLDDPSTIKAAAEEVRRYLMKRLFSGGAEP
jgi:DNA repair exonuclease SbcCD nuclease subunit